MQMYNSILTCPHHCLLPAKYVITEVKKNIGEYLKKKFCTFISSQTCKTFDPWFNDTSSTSPTSSCYLTNSLFSHTAQRRFLWQPHNEIRSTSSDSRFSLLRTLASSARVKSVRYTLTAFEVEFLIRRPFCNYPFPGNKRTSSAPERSGGNWAG